MTLLAAVEPLPGPGIFGRLMDGQPWLISAVLVVAGIGAFMLLRNQGKPRPGGIWLLALVGLAAALQVASYLVVTERERMSEATMELVRATARAETARLGPMLTEDARLIASTNVPEVVIPREGWTKGEILAAVSRYLGGRFAPEGYAVLEVQAQQRGPNSGRTQVRVRVEFGGYPSLSWWRIDWRKGEDGQWRAMVIEPVELNRF